jgi:tetratricopeptide (TPR) repeat protein
LLFRLLRNLTGAHWPSAFVAALFALHPLHVESVAWISERKDVLSALLCLLALWAYVRYAEAGSRGRYWTVMIVFAAGLMAKPMLVTVPFLLLVLDYWPLGRLRLGSPAAFREFRTALSPLVREKLPLFALAAASSTVTVIAQGEAVSSFERLPFATRVGNSIISYTTYLWMTIWPARLGLLYPYPRGSVEAWKTLGSLLLIGGITILAVRQARKRPYLVAGWCWYLGMLVPAIGLVQVGAQARADRYTYLPLIGLFLIVAWGLGEAAARRRALRTAVTVLATAAVAALALRAHTQAGYWRNSITLYERTLEVAPDNPIMLLNLGIEYMDRGRLDEAMACYRKALPLEPGSGRLHAALGTTLARKGRHEEAMEHLKEALRLNPGLSFANHSMGVLLLSQKKLEEALPFLRDSVRNDPENADAHNTLGAALLLQGKAPEAIEQFNAALRIRPDFPDARNNLRTAMQSAGKE